MSPLLWFGFERADLVEPDEDAKIEECGTYMDDIKELELQPELARKARREELKVFMERGVCEVVPRSSMGRRSKLIGIRWAETCMPRACPRAYAGRYVRSDAAAGCDQATAIGAFIKG